MSEIKVERTFYIEPTPQELADCFSGMDADKQAEFFNRLYGQDNSWGPNTSWPFQFQYITDSEILSINGREMMRMIGEYSEYSARSKLTQES